MFWFLGGGKCIQLPFASKARLSYSGQRSAVGGQRSAIRAVGNRSSVLPGNGNRRQSAVGSQ